MKVTELTCYQISRLAVPLGFNCDSNRFECQISCCSDTSRLVASFYEYHGMYWYSLQVDSFKHEMNSIPYLSLSNCISDFRNELRGNQFRFENKAVANAVLSRLVFCSKSSEV